MVALPLLEVLPLLTAMSIYLERPKQGQNPEPGQIEVKPQSGGALSRESKT